MSLLSALKSRISIGKRCRPVSIVLAVILVVLGIICARKLSMALGVALAALSILAGFMKVELRARWTRALAPAVWVLGLMALAAYSGPRTMGMRSLLRLDLPAMALNVLFPTCLFLIFWVITGRWKGSAVAGSLVAMILGTINAYVYLFRGKEMVFTDVFSVATAANVAGHYNFIPNVDILLCWTLWFGLCIAAMPFPLPPSRPAHPWRTRLIALAAAVVSCTVMWTGAARRPLQTWDRDGSILNGTLLNFTSSIHRSFISAPEGYTPERLEETARAYVREDASAQRKPHVLVIMSESYADLSVLGSELRTSRPVTPFMDSLQENTLRGYALSSVYGGNTANSEFELLTGHSMAFIPEGSVPYQQYIYNNTWSLPWYMAGQGYQVVSTHPNLGKAWSRERIYPLLGMEHSAFLHDYDNPSYMRGWVDDESFVTQCLSMLEERESGKPLFFFGITVQNHGGYAPGSEAFEDVIHLEGYAGDYPDVETYLTMLSESDKAMERLFTALSSMEEDVVVLFFGDHFPGLSAGFYQEVLGGSFDTLDKQLLKYTVPWFVWANYDIEEGSESRTTSLGYLPIRLLEAAGIPLPPYYRFLKDAEAAIPALNPYGYYSLSQERYLSLPEARGEEARWLNLYAQSQYNSLFDTSHRSETFFGQDLP